MCSTTMLSNPFLELLSFGTINFITSYKIIPTAARILSTLILAQSVKKPTTLCVSLCEIYKFTSKYYKNSNLPRHAFTNVICLDLFCVNTGRVNCRRYSLSSRWPINCENSTVQIKRQVMSSSTENM